MPEVIVAKPEHKDRPDRNIEELKRRAKELCGGHMETARLDDCPEEIEESFWKHVLDYEEAPYTTNFQQLETAGVSLPQPDSLTDQELTAKLWEVIHKLALLRVFISQTDHLSDRELYTHLWTNSLREEVKVLPPHPDSAWHVELLGSWSEEDTRLYLKYYADAEWRQDWHRQFPEYLIPAHEDPPYDRDRFLPKADSFGPLSDEPN
jgi:hypothetical protein